MDPSMGILGRNRQGNGNLFAMHLLIRMRAYMQDIYREGPRIRGSVGRGCNECSGF